MKDKDKVMGKRSKRSFEIGIVPLMIIAFVVVLIVAMLTGNLDKLLNSL